MKIKEFNNEVITHTILHLLLASMNHLERDNALSGNASPLSCSDEEPSKKRSRNKASSVNNSVTNTLFEHDLLVDKVNNKCASSNKPVKEKGSVEQEFNSCINGDDG